MIEENRIRPIDVIRAKANAYNDADDDLEGGEMSRQRRWQIMREREGLCGYCPNVAERGGICEPCREKRKTRYRNRYRLKRGIPLDAPIGPQGPKRHQ